MYSGQRDQTRLLSVHRGLREVHNFSATIYRSGINYQVDIPENITLEMGERKYIPVRGTVDGNKFRATLIPRKGNRHVLYINSELRRKAGVGVNNTVKVEFEHDPDSREIELPLDVELIFSENPLVLEKFLSISPSHRRELLKYIIAAKREETRLKRIELVAQRMLERLSNK